MWRLELRERGTLYMYSASWKICLRTTTYLRSLMPTAKPRIATPLAATPPASIARSSVRTCLLSITEPSVHSAMELLWCEHCRFFMCYECSMYDTQDRCWSRASPTHLARGGWCWCGRWEERMCSHLPQWIVLREGTARRAERVSSAGT